MSVSGLELQNSERMCAICSLGMRPTLSMSLSMKLTGMASMRRSTTESASIEHVDVVATRSRKPQGIYRTVCSQSLGPAANSQSAASSTGK